MKTSRTVLAKDKTKSHSPKLLNFKVKCIYIYSITNLTQLNTILNISFEPESSIELKVRVNYYYTLLPPLSLQLTTSLPKLLRKLKQSVEIVCKFLPTHPFIFHIVLPFLEIFKGRLPIFLLKTNIKTCIPASASFYLFKKL